MDICACMYNDCNNLLTYLFFIMTIPWGKVVINYDDPAMMIGDQDVISCDDRRFMLGDIDVIICDDAVVVLGDQDVKAYLWRTTQHIKLYLVEPMKMSDQAIFLMMVSIIKSNKISPDRRSQVLDDVMNHGVSRKGSWILRVVK